MVFRSGLGFVGKVHSVNTDAVLAAIKSGYLPILTSMAETEHGQSLVRTLYWP